MPQQQPQSQTLEAIHLLKEEIGRLNEQQTNALSAATYLGMTTDEDKEYEERSEKILRCVQDVKTLEESI